MDQQTINYWCTQYINHVGCAPLSPIHLNEFILLKTGNLPYFNVINFPPMFIPNSPQEQTIKTKPLITLNKKHCPDGMSCKNVFCTSFHHPSADLTIFLRK
jgi:hypothetical protein